MVTFQYDLLTTLNTFLILLNSLHPYILLLYTVKIRLYPVLYIYSIDYF